jgi:hypothetical protein
MSVIQRFFERRPPTFQYGRVAQIVACAGKIRVVTASGAEIWCDIVADIALGDTVVISGTAPRFVVQRATGMLPATTTIGLV